jgi:hypothetical protein
MQPTETVAVVLASVRGWLWQLLSAIAHATYGACRAVRAELGRLTGPTWIP